MSNKFEIFKSDGWGDSKAAQLITEERTDELIELLRTHELYDTICIADTMTHEEIAKTILMYLFTEKSLSESQLTVYDLMYFKHHLFDYLDNLGQADDEVFLVGKEYFENSL